MPKYNPKNKQHRKTLATRITKMLVVAGFKLDKTARSAEDVYRLDIAGVKKGTAYVRVSTSISKGEMRTVGTDAIRVYAVYTDNAGKSRGLVKTTNINRTGGMAAITGRLLAAMGKTKRTAAKRANDAGFHALPVKTYAKKKWVPKGKKAASKSKTAKKLNAALKASDKRINAALKAKADADFPLSSLTYEVGQLVESRNSEMLKGMVKAANKAIITVFWFHDSRTQQVSPLDIAPLSVAA
jgi:hypothetical protein